MGRRFRSAAMNLKYGNGMFLNALSLACDPEAHNFASYVAVKRRLDEIWSGRIMIFDDADVLISLVPHSNRLEMDIS